MVTGPGSLQVGLMVEPQMGGTYQDLVDLARWAEEHGFDTMARSDHYLDMDVSRPVTDAFTAMGGLAVETASIGLTVLVSPITFRHPAVIAKAAATLHEMSTGRFELGMGTGWMQGEHDAFGLPLPSVGERFAMLEEALAYLSAALGRRRGPVAGDRYRLGDLTPLPSPGDGLRVIVGGSGPRRTPRLAGTYADELNLFGADPETVRTRVAATRQAAETAGRHPDSIAFSAMMSPLVGRDTAEFEDRLRSRLARSGASRERFLARLDERGTPYGTVDEVTERFAEIARLGLSRVYLQQFDPLADIDRENALLALGAARAI
jgi:alkanesulfonate monooxygenase SsuD/methylene tetrahydromethanopterin reductase-like flavin-dependent oxidoreductase (luciferase family)